jgi:hypothetical protein
MDMLLFALASSYIPQIFNSSGTPFANALFLIRYPVNIGDIHQKLR